MRKLKILVVGGTWDIKKNENNDTGYISIYSAIMDGVPSVFSAMFVEYGKCSGLINKISEFMQPYARELTCFNGGYYHDLSTILEREAGKYDVVFWLPNVSNDLPKVRNVKELHPKIMLVTSKRNIDDAYTFEELIQQALASKSNLIFEFSNVASALGDKPHYKLRVFDPLGCVWADTTDVEAAVKNAMERLIYLRSITRQSTIQSDAEKEAIAQGDEVDAFIDIVKSYAQVFQELMSSRCKTERFVGNASMKPKGLRESRCGKGMPSFRYDDAIWVSRRNVDKQFIDRNCFVPVNMIDENLYYCGTDKPSVDTPVQVRLYSSLPNIRYMLHSHCYLKEADITTTKAIPCGAIEEVGEILSCIDKKIGSRECTSYKINILGHGSIVMGSDISSFENLEYVERPLPEIM